MNLADELRRIARNSIRTYFAPLNGAIKGIRAELRRVDRDTRRQRDRLALRRRRQADSR